MTLDGTARLLLFCATRWRKAAEKCATAGDFDGALALFRKAEDAENKALDWVDGRPQPATGDAVPILEGAAAGGVR